MELTKNIFFNTDKLVENSKVKISYTGTFFQDSSKEVFFHYGFGNNYSFPIEKKPVELIVLSDEPVSLGSARKLRKSYIWSKKIRLAVYKIITYLPKLISGNYKKKASNNE